ncbi:MAG: nucleotidyltransferase family protein [bacterium]|nr:nucleotidyltransferase family protein [bacterium]
MKKKIIRKKNARVPRLSAREETFIYDICLWGLGKKTDLPKSEGLREDVLFNYLRLNGCGGLFHKFLEASDYEVSDEYREYYRDEFLTILMKNTLYLKVARRVDEIAVACSIKYVMVKGTAMIESVYNENGVRPLSDIDLIVESREEALQLISQLKGEPVSEDDSFSRRYKTYDRMVCPVHDKASDRWVEVEVHFPVKDSIFAMSELFFNIVGPLFRDAERVGGISIPSPTMHFLVLFLHLVHHHIGARLIWNYDIASLVETYGENLDWDVIIRECRELDFGDALFYFLRMLKESFLADVPQAVLEKAEADACTGTNHGLLKEMVSGDNVIMDSFGGGKIWRFPSLSLKKLKPIIFFTFFPYLFQDLPGKWYTFNLGSKRKKRVMGELSCMTLFKDKFVGKNTLFKRFMGAAVTLWFSSMALPILVYYNLKSR